MRSLKKCFRFAQNIHLVIIEKKAAVAKLCVIWVNCFLSGLDFLIIIFVYKLILHYDLQMNYI